MTSQHLLEQFVVVTPIFEDAEASTILFAELGKVFGTRAFMVAVDDGSVRQKVACSSITAAGLCGVVVRLKRNLGHQRAIAVGLNYAAEHLPDRRVVVMDSDGEDVPRTIQPLLDGLLGDAADVVVAQRRSRVESLRFRLFYVVYKWLFRLLTGRAISFGNFMGLNPAAVSRLASMQELWIHVASCVLTSRLRIATYPVDRGPRYAGESRMNFVALALHGFRALMVFAEDVLVRVGIACSLVAALAILASIAALALKMLGYATPGWFSVALGILLLVFLQTGTLTLMTLMLTGVVRGASMTRIPYDDLIESVTSADLASTPAP